MSNSLSLIAPVSQAPNVNTLFEALGRGPGNLSRNFSADGQEPASHKGCHTYDDELASIIGSRVVPEDAPIGNYGLSAEDAGAALNSIEMLQASADNTPSVNVATLASSLGLLLIEPVMEV